MSRAFVKDDDSEPPIRFGLPDPNDPSYDAAAALVLIEAARDGNRLAAEEATGYRWGDPLLYPYVEKLLEKEESQPEEAQDHRFNQMARRYLAG